MSRLTCSHCKATTEGVVLCKRCQTTASVALLAIAANHPALFSLGTTPPRVRRRSGPADPTGNGASRTDGLGSPAENAAAETTNMLSTWVRVLLDDRTELSAPPNTVAAMVTFLGQHLRTIAVLEWAGELVRELLIYERRLQRLVSSGQAYWYAGICGGVTGSGVDDWCPADLFVTPGDTFLRCRACGTFWSVAQRREQVIAQARDALLPVAVIARAVVQLLEGEPSQQRLEARLRKWVERGVLVDYGVRVLVPGTKPRRVYRLGDVIDRLTREASGVSA